MSDTIRNTIVRFALIFLFVLSGFVAVLVKIVHIQTVEKDTWETIAREHAGKDFVIAPNRGNILDAKGRLLAGSLPQYYVYMDTRVEALHQKHDSLYRLYADSIAEGLSLIVGDMSAKEYRQRMDRAFRGMTVQERDFRICPRRVNYMQRKAIGQLPLVKRGYYKSGFHYEQQHRRSKPYGSLGSRTIGGIYGEGGNGKSGLEKYYDEYLRGKEGLSIRQKVAGEWEKIPEIEAEDGCDIITTLDADLLDICETALRQRLARTSADWGCCILMEVKTGAVKAVCNLDRTADGDYEENINHAAIRVEPGSTFKTVSLTAVLDDGKASLDDTLRVYRNGWTYHDARHTDSHPKDTVYTVRSALAVSSNIAFAKLVTESYEKKAEKFVNKLGRMGLRDGFRVEIPGASAPRIDVPNDAVTLSKMAYGYSVELSPLQIAAFYNGIANGGHMVRPMLVRTVMKDGAPVKEYGTETISTLCRQSTLRDVQAALHDVVWDNDLGTASVLKWQGRTIYRKAQSDLVHIAGKTGTAQLFHHGRYHSDEHRMTFVGYFPEEAPEYTCLCMIEHPRNRGAYDAGFDCGTVVRRIAEQTMAYAGEYRWSKGRWIWTKTCND